MIRTGKQNTTTFLSFKLSGEVFAIDVSWITNILEINTMTKYPDSFDFFKGIVYMKDAPLPVIDLKNKFGLPGKEIVPGAGIIVLTICLNNELINVGIIADVIREVLDIPDESLKTPSSAERKEYSKFIEFTWQTNTRTIKILDSEKLFSASEIEYFKVLSEQPVI